MDGITAAKNMKEKRLTSKIIFLTNLKDEEHISQAIEIEKETEYIVKSDLHLDQIVARVKEKLA
jgi:DNA-binding NarL/FixJ family response regulator